MRYRSIISAEFDGVDLPLPTAARTARKASPAPAASDDQLFATSIELTAPVVTVELTMRATAVAESLAIGRCGPLSLLIGPADATGSVRRLHAPEALLLAVDIIYANSTPAVATLTFALASPDGLAEPLTAEDEE
jgi:hypothetical protein